MMRARGIVVAWAVFGAALSWSCAERSQAPEQSVAMEQPAESVIVQGENLDDVVRAVKAVGGEITRELVVTASVAAELTEQQRVRLSHAPGIRVTGDDAIATRIVQPDP